jgi:hypothetical protein
MIATVSSTVNPRKTWHDLRKHFANEKLDLSHLKFPRQRQNETPVTDARGTVKIINFLPGPQAARFRDVCANIVVRFLEGDASLVEEIGRKSVRNTFDMTLNFSALAQTHKKRDGLVYAVTLPHVHVVKIGM